MVNINPTRRAKDRIYSELPDNLKRLMMLHILPEDEHARLLETIKKSSYEGKEPVEIPTFTIVVGQTGSGKSHLTSYLYRNNSNVVIIDSDKYKAYREDNEDILKKYLVEYAFLTAPDAYLHRDEMIVDAMEKKYNILMEIAPSQKEGLFVDVLELQNRGYEVNINVLGVGALNSLLSVHERYESNIQSNNITAKLTSINRHDDSFYSLNSTIQCVQNIPNLNINVFARGNGFPYVPNLIYSSNKNDDRRYSCPLEALMSIQCKDEQETLLTFTSRYDIIRIQMTRRNAPIKQLEQLEQLRLRYEQKIHDKFR